MRSGAVALLVISVVLHRDRRASLRNWDPFRHLREAVELVVGDRFAPITAPASTAFYLNVVKANAAESGALDPSSNQISDNESGYF